MRMPRFICTSPASSTQGMRNMTTRSGSAMRSRIFALAYLGFLEIKGARECATSSAA
jgi:hypothetical protein